MDRNPQEKGLPHPNAYQFYTFAMMGKYRWPQSYVEGLKALLPGGQISCQACRRNQADFIWCSPLIYGNRYASDRLSDLNSFERQMLCKTCLVESFTVKIRELGLWFDEFNPPVDDDGFATSFDT